MNKFIAAFLFAVGVFSCAHAQPISEVQHLPYQQNGDFTPYQQSISENFLFLVDDDIQKVLFNPARAGEMDNAFMSTVIYPSENLDNFRLAGLTKDNWFFAFGGTYRQSNSEGTLEDVVYDVHTEEQGGRFYDYFKSTSTSYDFTNIRTEGKADLSVSKIIRTSGGKNYSLGVFLGYSKENQDLNELSQQVYISNSTLLIDDTLRVRDEGNTLNIHLADNVTLTEKIVFGISFNSYNDGVDSRHRIYVQKNNVKRELNELDTQLQTRAQDDYTNSEFQDIIFERETRKTLVGNVDPLQVRYSGYINKPVSWITNNDFIFLNLKALYSKGNSKQEQSFSSEILRTTNGDITEISEDFDSFPAVEVDDRLWGGIISLGYLMKVESNDLNFFTGINPYYGLSDEETFDIENYRGLSIDKLNQEAGVQIPVYTSYSITEHFNIWGGANVHSRFYREKTREVTFPDLSEFGNPELILVKPLVSKRIQNSFTLSESLFMGFKLSHESGLSLVNNFRSNLTSVNSWVVSLRYSF